MAGLSCVPSADSTGSQGFSIENGEVKEKGQGQVELP